MSNAKKFNNIGLNAYAWPFVEAKKILNRIQGVPPKKGYVLFETGYGPSGLPHIGTFGEVARTSMIRYAFEQLSDIPTKLFAFSDDLDGMRKIPSNIPNQALLLEDIGKPLSKVKDPFEKYGSFAEHNNSQLQQFLDNFGFEYTFYSSTHCYQSGMFDDALLNVLKHYDEIAEVILPTLGSERQGNYSPFLPISTKTGRVLQAKVISKDITKGTIVYIDEDNTEVETLVTGGACKLQWKVDWGMRWWAFEVDYEMSGKDLIPSVVLSSKICKILGKEPPVSLTYELFLDKTGEKISKSKGNGLSIEDWLKYGNKESLSYFMYQKPQTAKKLYFEAIPRSIDEWLGAVNKYPTLTDEEKAESPILFIHKDNPPVGLEEISFFLLINLVSVVNTDDKKLLWLFLDRYKAFNQVTKEVIDNLLEYVINYHQDFIRPSLKYKQLTDMEKSYVKKLRDKLSVLEESTPAVEVQRVVYEVGKETDLILKDWFKLLYQSLLGQDEGPRIGSFFTLYGLNNSIALIEKAIDK